MIEKNEVLEIAKALRLNPDTVEKDYVLSWILYGINNYNPTSTWAFKGGTSLKKCFFETFRFSEDLDFTLPNNNQLEAKVLYTIFGDIINLIHEKTGIEFFKEKLKFKIIPRKNGKIFAQGKIHYNGPLRRKSGIATIKLDLTTDEILILNSIKKEVHHPYSDKPEKGIFANCYAFEEIIAEKIRALVQRIRPRDLYDIIHFFRNRDLVKNPQLILSVLKKKCHYKEIDIPIFQHVKEHEKLEELKSQWKNMLGHQLPYLPSIDSFWIDLKPFFDWLYDRLKVQKVKNISKKDITVYHFDRFKNINSINPLLYRIQFAAANRLCIKITYHNTDFIVESLSFRISGNKNYLFYGYERNSKKITAFSLSKIQSIEITNNIYIEREYPVEITASGIISMPPLRMETQTSF